jgi:hypothetical protein
VIRHVIPDLKAATGCVPWKGRTNGVDASWKEVMGLEQLT